MLREEWNRYAIEIGEAMRPIEWGSTLLQALGAGALMALPLWLAKLGLDLWWMVLSGFWFVLLLLFAFWKRLNDPEPGPLLMPGFPDSQVPPEAIGGFFAAFGVVGLVLLIMWLF